MRVSRAGVALVKQFEGCRLEAYVCPAGVLTIGYGHTTAAGAPTVTEGMVITQARAEEILRWDLGKVASDVHALLAVGRAVDLAQGQFDALVSFTFNLGIGALRRSTLLKRINEGRLDAVPAEFMKWTKARVDGELVDLPGLVRRRRAEAALWRGVDEAAPVDPDESRATPEPPRPSKTMASSKEGNAAIITGAGAAAGAAQQIAEQAGTATSLAQAIGDLVGKPGFWVFVVIIAAAAGIWFWRRQRLLEEAA